jgi:hypothetical protein
VARADTAARVERIVRAWRRLDRRAEAREAARQHASRGLHVSHDEDGTRRTVRATGWPRATGRTPPAVVPDDPAEAIRAENEARQIRISPRTACARWTGERLDVGWAIDVLHPGAAPGSGGGIDGAVSR